MSPPIGQIIQQPRGTDSPVRASGVRARYTYVPSPAPETQPEIVQIEVVVASSGGDMAEPAHLPWGIGQGGRDVDEFSHVQKKSRKGAPKECQTMRRIYA